MTFARIVIACSIASIVITVAGVVFRSTVGCRTASKLDPMDLDVARFVIAIPRVVPSRIGAARHRCLLLLDRALLRRRHVRLRWLVERLCVAHGSAAIGDRMESVLLGSRGFLSAIVSPDTCLARCKGMSNSLIGRLKEDLSEGLGNCPRANNHGIFTPSVKGCRIAYSLSKTLTSFTV
jgi:hypothetical protein